jgi:Secretion system C-terminal sorting domain
VVFPNPSEGNFSIELEAVKQSAVGILSDLNGKEIAVFILKKGQNSIQNEGLAKGTYLLTINIDGISQAKKIVIK